MFRPASVLCLALASAAVARKILDAPLSKLVEAGQVSVDATSPWVAAVRAVRGGRPVRLALALLMLTAVAARADMEPFYPAPLEPGGMIAGLCFAAAACTSWWATRTVKPGAVPRFVRGALTLALVFAGIGSYVWAMKTSGEKIAAENAIRRREIQERRRQYERERNAR